MVFPLYLPPLWSWLEATGPRGRREGKDDSTVVNTLVVMSVKTKDLCLDGEGMWDYTLRLKRYKGGLEEGIAP